MAGFERLAHYGRVAGAVESIDSAAVGQGHQMRNDIVGDLLRVNEMGHAELAPPFFSVGIDIDADDHIGARHLRALKHVEADAAETENDNIVAGTDLRRVPDGADATGDTATYAEQPATLKTLLRHSSTHLRLK